MATKINVEIDAKTQAFEQAISRTQNSTQGLSDAVKNLGKASAVAFAGLTAVVGTTVKSFADFDNQLKSVKTLLNDNSFGAKGLEKGFNELRKDVIDLGKSSAVSFDELNKSLFDTISAGVEASKAIGVLTASTQLATAGVTDVATATDGLTSALNAFGISADDANQVAAKFFSAQVEGKTTIEELSNSIGLVASSASAAGVSLDELLAATASVTTAGVRTNAAMTGLKAALANVAKPTADAAKEANRLGIEFNASALRSKGLERFLGDLTKANGFTQDSVTRLFGSVEAQNVIFALTGAQAEKFSNTVNKLGNEQKNAAEFAAAFNTQNSSLTNQFTILQNQLQATSILIGERLAPLITKLVIFFKNLNSTLSDNPALLDLITNLGLAATGVTALGTAIGGATLLVAAFASPIGLVASSVAALSAAFVVLSDKLDLFGDGSRGIIGELETIGAKLTMQGGIVDKVSNAWQRLIGFFSEADSSTSEPLALIDPQTVPTIEQALAGIDELTDKKQGEPLVLIDPQTLPSIQQAAAGLENLNLKLRTVQETGNEIREELAAQQEADDELAAQRQEQTVANEQAQFEAKLARIQNQKQRENETRLKFEQRKIDEEEKLVRDAEKKNLDTTKSNIKTLQQLEESDRQRRIAARNRENQLRVQDEINSNKAVADANAFFRSKEVSQSGRALDQLATLQSANSKTLFRIGQAAALARAVINTAQGVTKALAEGGPFAGPLAAAVAAAGAVQIATISSTRFQGAQDGALVQGGIPGRDSVPILAQQGELIAPTRNFEEVIGSVRAQREAETLREEGGDGTVQEVEVTVGFADNAFEIIEQKLIERRTLNVGLI